MNIDLWIVIVMLAISCFAPQIFIYILVKENKRMGRELGELHKQILKNQLVEKTLDASVKTGSMLGPATLQQMKEPPKPEEKEPQKQSGVILKC